MDDRLRKLNEEGMRRFAEYISGNAIGTAPLHLLTDPDTSDPVKESIILGSVSFTNRYDFGTYLFTLLKELDSAQISNDKGLWSALGLYWFDRLCPPDASGHRKVDKGYRYILSDDYRHYYRHLIRTPWKLVQDHGENARFLLISPRDQANPLSVHGEILEQFGGRQQVLASKPIIAAASMMFLDQKTGKPRTGVAGSGRGSARRFGMVLRQLDLTYDPESMADGALISVLPTEFDRWKPASEPSARAAVDTKGDAAPLHP